MRTGIVCYTGSTVDIRYVGIGDRLLVKVFGEEWKPAKDWNHGT